MGSSECREALVELAETLCDVPQCLILSHQHVRSVSRRLRRRGIALGSPTPRVLFFHDLRFAGGNQVMDSTISCDLLPHRMRHNCQGSKKETIVNLIRGCKT